MTITQYGLRFRVRHADGRSETLLVDAERALVGSAPFCEVRLPSDVAEAEHLEVVTSDGLVHLTSRATQARARLDGIEVTSCLWGSGQILRIGAATLRVEVVDLAPAKKGVSPLWLLALIPIAALVTTLAYAARPNVVETSIPTPPALFAETETGCPVADAEQAAPLAEARLRSALSKRERRPFAPREGVDAVALFEAAASCFAVAGNADEQRDATERAGSLRVRIEEEYQVRRVRLEHAFRVADPVAAKRELSVLLPLTSGLQSPYVEWMASLSRDADLAIEQRSQTRL